MRQQHESNNIESAPTQETDMIRPAKANDDPEIRECAEQAYARYVPVIGRKPAPMVADFNPMAFKAQVAQKAQCGKV